MVIKSINLRSRQNRVVRCSLSKMADMSFLNHFNNLLICSVRFDSYRGRVKASGVIRNTILLSIVTVSPIYFLFKLDFEQDLSRIKNISVVLRFVITLVTCAVILLESVWNHNKILHLTRIMADHANRMRWLDHKGSNIDVPFIRVEIGIILSLLLIMNLYTIYVYWNYLSILMIVMGAIFNSNACYVTGNLVFMQFFAQYVSGEYLTLRLQLPSHSLEDILSSADSLNRIKKAISRAFGKRLLLLLFHLLVNVSFCSYDIMTTIVEQKSSGWQLIRTIYVLLTVFLVNMVSLFGVSYSFDRVATEVSGMQFG